VSQNALQHSTRLFETNVTIARLRFLTDNNDVFVSGVRRPDCREQARSFARNLAIKYLNGEHSMDQK